MRAYHSGRLLAARLKRTAPQWEGVRILGYHWIGDTAKRDPLAVAPAVFRRQMEILMNSDVEVIRLDRAVQLLDGSSSGRYVCVTFDDGYADNFENAEPVLSELGIPGTTFLPTTIIDGQMSYWWSEDPPRAATWNHVAEAAARGVIDFQSHSRTHAWLPQLDDQAARDEIAGSKEDIERNVSYPVTAFAYPGGLYGSRDAQLVQKAGYKVAVSTTPGVNRGDTPRYELRRTLVYGDDGRSSFEAKLAGLLDTPPRLRPMYYKLRARTARGPS